MHPCRTSGSRLFRRIRRVATWSKRPSTDCSLAHVALHSLMALSSGVGEPAEDQRGRFPRSVARSARRPTTRPIPVPGVVALPVRTRRTYRSEPRPRHFRHRRYPRTCPMSSRGVSTPGVNHGEAPNQPLHQAGFSLDVSMALTYDEILSGWTSRTT